MSKLPKRAFDHCAEEYARFRPGYPPELLDDIVALCDPERCGPVADIGAGTGIFTRLLLRRGYHVVAVEPSEAMLKRIPGPESDPRPPVRLLCAAAERTGLATGSVGLIACAQSFHWFNPPEALAEFARILAPGGHLVLTWNNRNRRGSPFVADFESLVKKYNPAYDVEYRQQDWPAKIDQTGLYSPASYRRFDWTWECSPEQIVGFTRSVSYIRNVLARAQSPCFEAELHELMGRHATDGRCQVPMRTDLWWSVRR